MAVVRNKPNNRPRMRWFQFNLRTLLVAMPLFGGLFGWLGTKVERARQHHQAATAAAALQGSGWRLVSYDYAADEPWRVNEAAPRRGSVDETALAHLANIRSLRSLKLHAAELDDAVIRQLGGLTSLEQLYLNATTVTDQDLVHLTSLTNLRTLSLDDTAITDAGLEHLRRLTALNMLRLRDTNVTGGGVKELQAALPGLQVDWSRAPTKAHRRAVAHLIRLGMQVDSFPRSGYSSMSGVPRPSSGYGVLPTGRFNSTRLGTALEHLTQMVDLRALTWTTDATTTEDLDSIRQFRELEILFWSGQIADAEMAALKGMTKLRLLDLSGTQVTDAGLADLMNLTELEWLGLSGTQVTDKGLASLKGLTKLEMIYLGRTQVTDTGLEHLKGLNRLRYLGLSGTQVTESGIQNLQKAIPDCQIRH